MFVRLCRWLRSRTHDAITTRDFAPHQRKITFTFFRLVKDQTASSPKDQRQATTHVSELSTFKIRGGGRRDRTDDPLLAKQVLSQLSYAPNKVLVGQVGIEPTTPALSRRCSNRLSY